MSQRYLILLVEESDSSLGFYDSLNGEEVGRVRLSLWPHEIAVSRDGTTAYVSNFGLRDYDLNLGFAGNAISVVNIPHRVETERLYTCTPDHPYWGPHGVKVSPDGRRLYVNVERVGGKRERDPNTIPGQDPTKLLVFDLATKAVINQFDVPLPLPKPSSNRRRLGLLGVGADLGEEPSSTFDVVQGSHNFVFSPDGANLWIFSGRTGVTRMNPLTGEITARLTDFNGAVRSLSFTPDGRLLVSATDEITLIDPKTLQVSQRISDLGITQLLYAKATPDNKFVLAPAVWEGQVIVVDLSLEKVVHRIVTGIDPVQVMVAPDGESAYVTHGRSRWLSEIGFSDFRERRRIPTLGGPNGAAFAPWAAPPSRKTITFGACLPFTGEGAVEAREIRLGYQHWQERVNAAGGVFLDGNAHTVDIKYADTMSTQDVATLRKLADQLITDGGIHCLLGSYPEIANLCVAEVVEKHQVPFVVGVAVDEELFRRHHRFVSAIVTDGFRFRGVLGALWRRLGIKPSSACVLSCDDPYVLKRARTTARHLRDLGLKLVSPDENAGDEEDIVTYPHLATDLSSLTTKIRDLAPDFLLHHGHRQEAIVLVGACAQADFTPGAICLDFGMTVANFRDQVGMLADNLIGTVHWSAGISNCAHDRFVAASDFGRNYFDEFSERASSLAAASAACGIVFEHALREAQTTEPEKLQRAIRSLDLNSFFGQIQFDAQSRNLFGSSHAVQFRRVGSDLQDVLIWLSPDSAKAVPVWPFPGW